MSIELPKSKLYETGSQIRRFLKSIRPNIVAGYGRRRYKKDYIKFLIYAHSSIDETRDHLQVLYETKSLTDKNVFDRITPKLDLIGKKLYMFIKLSKKIIKL